MEAYTAQQYQESAAALERRLGGFRPKVLLILGSGLGALGDEVENPVCGAPRRRTTGDSSSSAAWRDRTRR